MFTLIVYLLLVASTASLLVPAAMCKKLKYYDVKVPARIHMSYASHDITLQVPASSTFIIAASRVKTILHMPTPALVSSSSIQVAWSAFSSSDPTVLNGKKFQDILRNPKERAKYNLIDIRSPEEMKLLYIDGHDILNIPLGTEDTWGAVVESIEKLNNKKPTIVMCATGLRSKIFSSFLTRTGFREVYILDGGLEAYASKIDSAIFH